MEVVGYKAFKGDFSNKYGAHFEIDGVYAKDPNTLKFGENGHGYHMALKLADTFRFFNPTADNVYCQVLGFGEVVQQDDYLYDSDSMYVVEKIKILKVMSREDIFTYACQADVKELRRFLALFPFTKEELEILRDIVTRKEKVYQQVFSDSLGCQTGDIAFFKRNRKYLRKIMD